MSATVTQPNPPNPPPENNPPQPTHQPDADRLSRIETRLDEVEQTQRDAIAASQANTEAMAQVSAAVQGLNERLDRAPPTHTDPAGVPAEPPAAVQPQPLPAAAPPQPATTSARRRHYV